MKKAVLLAYPAGHSLSPAMHNAAFAHVGLLARYEARQVAPSDLVAAVQSLRAADCYGANITIPHKEAVVALADELSDEARAIGAVNTLVHHGGMLLGHNTDAGGFLRALHQAGFAPQGKHALVLGAGGAARAVAYALLRAGVARLDLHNRSKDRAEALAGRFAALGQVRVPDDSELEAGVRDADLLVNTTPVGMEQGGVDPGVSPLPGGLLPVRALVVDLIYRPAETRLLAGARAAGLAVQNGLPMLVYQGAASFALWTGREAPAEIMFEAARAALAGRSVE